MQEVNAALSNASTKERDEYVLAGILERSPVMSFGFWRPVSAVFEERQMN